MSLLFGTWGLPRTDGHNIFLYHHPANRSDPMDVDFGVEVTRSFASSRRRVRNEPARRRSVIAVHRGPYDQLKAAHDAIHQSAAANNRAIGRASWEIYSDPTSDPSRTETAVVYLPA